MFADTPSPSLVGGDQLEVVEDWHVDPAGDEAEDGEGEDHGQQLRALGVHLGRHTDQGDGWGDNFLCTEYRECTVQCTNNVQSSVKTMHIAVYK